MSKDDLPPLLMLIIWAITFFSLLTLLAIYLAIIPHRNSPRPKSEIQEPFVYQWTSHVMPMMEVRAVITAYNPVPEQTDDTPHITASGERVREGIVACPVWLPFGTLVEIDGRLYECQDRMHPRYWHQARFDILMFDYWQAREWGKQVKVVRIYK